MPRPSGRTGSWTRLRRVTSMLDSAESREILAGECSSVLEDHAPRCKRSLSRLHPVIRCARRPTPWGRVADRTRVGPHGFHDLLFRLLVRSFVSVCNEWRSERLAPRHNAPTRDRPANRAHRGRPSSGYSSDPHAGVPVSRVIVRHRRSSMAAVCSPVGTRARERRSASMTWAAPMIFPGFVERLLPDRQPSIRTVTRRQDLNKR